MKTLYRNKAVTLYETRMSAKYAIMTAVFYALAAILWYMICAFAPYLPRTVVSSAANERLTREAFTATAAEVARPESEKERALLMPTSEESFVRRLRLIEDAERTIDFVVYDNYEDSGPAYFYGAVLRAADRGVKVRLIFDGKMGRLKGKYRDLQDILQNHNNIEVYLFNPTNILKPSGLFVLCHDKITIVDDDKMIVGGANMGMGAYTANYDMEVMITNSGKDGVVGRAKEYFDSVLSSGLAERKISKKCDFSAKERYKDEFIEYYEAFSVGEVDYAEQGAAVDRVTFLSNPVNDGKKEPIIYQGLMNLMESSQDTAIVTPYALLTDEKIDTLIRNARRNRRVRLVTNSLYNTRNVGYAVYQAEREKYIDGSVELWEFQADNQLHAKMFTFDGRYSAIGSFNLDERSAHVDTESMLVIDSEAFAAAVNRYIDGVFIANSLRVGEDNEYIPSDTVSPGVVPDGKAFKYKLMNILSLLINII